MKLMKDMTKIQRSRNTSTTKQLFANRTLQCVRESLIHSICPTSKVWMMHWPPQMLSEVLWSLLSSSCLWLFAAFVFASASPPRCFASKKRSKKLLLLRKLKNNKLLHLTHLKEVWLCHHQCTTQEWWAHHQWWVACTQEVCQWELFTTLLPLQPPPLPPMEEWWDE